MAKFIFDRVAAFFGLLFLLPVLLVLSVLVACKMPGGPIFFRQQRVGKGGRLFTIYKFRTMDHVPQDDFVTVAGEDRITPFGAVLRKCKLDELPELWNVLIGDMSFVGPRPQVPEQMGHLQGEQCKILELRPGITGPATLKYSHEEEMLSRAKDPIHVHRDIIAPDKARINLDYYYHHTLGGDIKLIFRTIFYTIFCIFISK